MDSVERTTVIRDDEGDQVTVRHSSDGVLMIETDGGQSVRLDAPAVRALVAAVTDRTPGDAR
jgi:hypothetical protein